MFLNSALVRAAIAEPTRMRMLWALSDGAALSVEQLGVAAKCNENLASKHSRVLCRAMVVIPVFPPDGDRRKQCYQIPAPFRTQDAEGRPALDFGYVLLRQG